MNNTYYCVVEKDDSLDFASIDDNFNVTIRHNTVALSGSDAEHLAKEILKHQNKSFVDIENKTEDLKGWEFLYLLEQGAKIEEFKDVNDCTPEMYNSIDLLLNCNPYTRKIPKPATIEDQYVEATRALFEDENVKVMVSRSRRIDYLVFEDFKSFSYWILSKGIGSVESIEVIRSGASK